MTDTFSIYDISNRHQFVQYYKKFVQDRCDNSDQSDSCWIWTKGVNEGCGALTYTFHVINMGVTCGIKKYTKAHRLIYACYYNNLNLLHPENKHVNCSHRCHNRRCCNPSHLVLETSAQNGSRSTCHHFRSNDTCQHNPPCIF